LPIVAFNPEGRLIVSGYPSGIVQVLDPVSGKELRTVETPRGYRGSLGYIQLSGDKNTLFVALGDSKFEPLRVGEKKTYFRRYSGEVRIYDLRTGAQKEPLKVEPRRGVISLAVSPDGTRVAASEYSSGLTDDFNRLRAIYLWDVKARKAVKLRDGYGDLRFSPDSKTVFVTVNDYAAKTGVMYAYSAATGKEVGKLENKDGLWQGLVFGPDGKWAAAAAADAKTKVPVVRLYDPRTLEPTAALAVGELGAGDRLSHVTFSLDGRRLAAVAKKTVYLWDVETRKLLRSWPLDTAGLVWHLIFDPAGRRLAATTWHIPRELQGARDEATTAQDYPQPKVFLIDLSAGKPEAIVCPHGYWGRPAFSPDGKLLAIGGAGAVHVFDVSKK
jgi:WD40 repeat protein